MGKLALFKRIVADFSDYIDFVMVYVQEAHAKDGWKMSGNIYTIPYHRSIDDRFQAANILRGHGNGLNCPLVIDTIENEAALQYAACPEALYVIEDGIVQYQGLGPFAYDPDSVRGWIESKLSKTN